MKRIICLLFSLIFTLLFLVGCSQAEKYNPEPLFTRSFRALLSGELYGVRTEVLIEMQAGAQTERTFFAHFLSGSLEGIIVRRDSEGVKISAGGLEGRSFYEGGLCYIADLFCAEEYRLVSEDKSTRTATLLAQTRDFEFFVIAGEGGIPRKFECEGVFSFDVKEFSLIK